MRAMHKNNHACWKCDYKTKHRGEVLNHIRRKHHRPEDFPTFYECSKCSERFAVKQDVHQHVRSAHKKNHPCCYCKAVFFTRSELNFHLSREHDLGYTKRQKIVIDVNNNNEPDVDIATTTTPTIPPLVDRKQAEEEWEAITAYANLFHDLSCESFSHAQRSFYDSEPYPETLDQFDALIEDEDDKKKEEEEEHEDSQLCGVSSASNNLKRKVCDDQPKQVKRMAFQDNQWC